MKQPVHIFSVKSSCCIVWVAISAMSVVDDEIIVGRVIVVAYGGNNVSVDGSGTGAVQ